MLPAMSVAAQLTVVVPNENVDPDDGEHTGVTDPLTASVDVAPEYVTTAPDGPVASAVTSLGAVTCGAVVSTTVTVNEPLPVLPAVSVAEQVTVVEPSANVEPDAGEHTGVTDPLTASVDDAPE
nr:hypothetical protein [Desertimonas flava]